MGGCHDSFNFWPIITLWKKRKQKGVVSVGKVSVLFLKKGNILLIIWIFSCSTKISAIVEKFLWSPKKSTTSRNCFLYIFLLLYPFLSYNFLLYIHSFLLSFKFIFSLLLYLSFFFSSFFCTHLQHFLSPLLLYTISIFLFFFLPSFVFLFALYVLPPFFFTYHYSSFRFLFLSSLLLFSLLFLSFVFSFHLYVYLSCLYFKKLYFGPPRSHVYFSKLTQYRLLIFY